MWKGMQSLLKAVRSGKLDLPKSHVSSSSKVNNPSLLVDHWY